MSLKAQQEFFDRLSSTHKRFEIFRMRITPSFTKRIATTLSDLFAISFEIASRKRQSCLHW